MKINFENLGKIKKTEIHLRPLTIIIGENNTNKTYLTYSIYGLMDVFKSTYINNSIFKHRNVQEKLNIKFTSKKQFTLELDEKVLAFIQKQLLKTTQEFEELLPDYFQDSSKKLFSNTKYSVDLTINDILHASRRIKRRDMSYFDYKHNDYDIQYKITVKSSKITIQLTSKLPRNNYPYEICYKSIIADLFTDIIDNIFPRVFILPAERNSLILTYKILRNRRFKSMRESKRTRYLKTNNQMQLFKESGELIYPKPLEDFLDFLSEIDEHYSFRYLEKRPLNEFSVLANKIESYLQNNNTTHFNKSQFGSIELQISVNKDLNIDLYNASSSIKQLIPLILYLRFDARPGELLLIDEPEMNLHPLSQAKLLEIITMIVNSGINVLITTHSPFILSHLNNLIKGGNNKPRLNKKATKLFLGEYKSFISEEKVNVYEMKNYKLINLKDPDYGYKWDSFSDVSTDIQSKYFEITETK